jgi:hypothetical protein
MTRARKLFTAVIAVAGLFAAQNSLANGADSRKEEWHVISNEKAHAIISNLVKENRLAKLTPKEWVGSSCKVEVSKLDSDQNFYLHVIETSLVGTKVRSMRVPVGQGEAVAIYNHCNGHCTDDRITSIQSDYGNISRLIVNLNAHSEKASVEVLTPYGLGRFFCN